ncbi:MAG TPA: UvrD-helicase domain-containing protein [Terracidiphilus sp.]|nr:UvrD-helicase domain-containing protein [Terracidiphilus sp.]
MRKTAPKSPPPDQRQREQALDPTRSILVQAPAGSGKTTLLTERFLTLLAEVDDPGQVVAITFTTAAAAEMRNRILDELRSPDPSLIARRALASSIARGWKLLDLPAQLRISTIDSFCRELALQQPLLSGLGGGLAIAEQPNDLYRRAARSTMEEIGRPGSPVSLAVESLLSWRDNNWQELEDLLVEMLSKRDRWMQEFVLSHNPDWDALRQRLERPFADAVRHALTQVSLLLDQVPGAREEALDLARFACEEPGDKSPWGLAECTEIPSAPFAEGLDGAREAFASLATFLQTLKGTWRTERGLSVSNGFPATPRGRAGKARFAALIAALSVVPTHEPKLAAVSALPPVHYSEADWLIVRACFTLLRHAAAQLKVVFAEAAAVDFIEVAQIAESVLTGEDGLPTDAALAVADGIRHLLVDEFQDTSRRQHQLLAGLIGAWPDRAGRTLFAVGDPMQSIYFFRDADAELFSRVKTIGLEIPGVEPFTLDFVPLTASFRTVGPLVDRLNKVFDQVFAEDDGSGVTFSAANPAREDQPSLGPHFTLNLAFIPQASAKSTLAPGEASEKDEAQAGQIEEIIALIRHRRERIEEAKAAKEKYRIAVLGRTRNSLIPIAQALHQADIPFRAVDLEKLGARPEVLDALALARALLNPQDRVAWLGVLRAPGCGLTLDDLHILTSADDPALLSRPVPDLLAERLPLLSQAGCSAAQRLLCSIAMAPALRASLSTASVGTALEQIWLSLGGAACCDATARANLDLLWNCLDRLPGGEQDLLGPALLAALDKLTALADPDTSSDCGVQLMTIHKSKGLEFEVVIVPDLQARTAQGSRKLLSWLERGVQPGSDSGPTDSAGAGAITEFLVAPLQSKGEDSGQSKAWVDRVYRERESQETRRILYVAATRARDELHLFARPGYKVEANGELSLVDPSVGLLATAWPALEEEIRARFDAWTAARPPTATAAEEAANAEIESIAASGNVITMPSPGKPTLLRRLPPDYACARGLGTPSFPWSSAERAGDHESQPAGFPSESVSSRPYSRHEGGLVSRALGTAVHSLFEELARLRATTGWEGARAALRRFEPRIAAQVRGSGIAPQQAASIAADALQLTLNASRDPVAQWILAPQPDAASEVSWSGVVDGNLTNVRVDRVFRAGLSTQSGGEAAWWIVDLKTAHADNLDPAMALPQLRPLFARQLETYAQVLRNLHGADAVVRAGLYYPRMLMLDWWEL